MSQERKSPQDKIPGSRKSAQRVKAVFQISRVLWMIKATLDFKELDLQMLSRGDMTSASTVPKSRTETTDTGILQDSIHASKLCCSHVQNFLLPRKLSRLHCLQCGIFSYPGKLADFIVHICVRFSLTKENLTSLSICVGFSLKPILNCANFCFTTLVQSICC